MSEERESERKKQKNAETLLTFRVCSWVRAWWIFSLLLLFLFILLISRQSAFILIFLWRENKKMFRLCVDSLCTEKKIIAAHGFNVNVECSATSNVIDRRPINRNQVTFPYHPSFSNPFNFLVFLSLSLLTSVQQNKDWFKTNWKHMHMIDMYDALDIDMEWHLWI